MKLKVLVATMAMALNVSAGNEKLVHEEKQVEVTIQQDGDKMVKKVVVNGKELTPEEIKQMEDNGELKMLHLSSDIHQLGSDLHLSSDHDGKDGKSHKVIVIDSDGEHKEIEKHIQIIKKQLDGDDAEVFEWNADDDMHKVFIKKGEHGDKEIKIAMDKMVVGNDKPMLGFYVDVQDDGWHVTKIIEKSGAEAAGIKEGDIVTKIAGQDMTSQKGDKSKKEAPKYEEGEKVKVELLRDGKKMKFEVEAKKLEHKIVIHDMLKDKDEHFKWIEKFDDGKHVKVFSGKHEIEHNGINLGFVTMKQDDGLHVGYMLDGSDAKKSGLKKGDLIKKIGNLDLSIDGENFQDNLKKIGGYKEGEMVRVLVERDGKALSFDVEAKKNDIFGMMRKPSSEFYEWLEEYDDSDSDNVLNKFNKDIKVMVFGDENSDFSFNDEDINIVFPKEFDSSKISFFVSDGHSTSKLLGKHHEMSSMSDDLSEYFDTNGGVLVLHVDESNVFGLKDGDVIKSVDDNDVSSPKDVVKYLIKAEDQEKIKLKVVRHKKNKTLKYNK